MNQPDPVAMLSTVAGVALAVGCWMVARDLAPAVSALLAWME